MEFLGTLLFILFLMKLLWKGIVANESDQPSSDQQMDEEPGQSVSDVFRRLMENESFQDCETVEEEQVPHSAPVGRETDEVLSSVSVKQGDTLTDAAKTRRPSGQQPLPLRTKEDVRRAVLYAEILRRKY